MADIRVNQLPDIAAIAAGDILHILDISSTDDVDSQTTVDAIADWIIANKSVRITGIDDVPGLRAALDGKADIVHTHTVAQVIGLQADLDNKTDLSQAQIIGRNIILNGNSINVPSTIGGLQDDRIPDTVVVGEYLQFGTTGGGINNITGDDLKGNLNINLVDNTSDIAKPVSTLQQTALDTKVNTSTYTTGQAEQDTRILSNTNAIAATALDILLNTLKRSYPEADETKLATIETNADVTDTTNVWSSLGISSSGSTGQFLTQRGVFVSTPDAIITKSEVDNAIGSGAESTDYYASDKTWKTIPTGGGTGEVTKGAVDSAIGAFPTGDSAQFYNEQGNFVDAVYDSVEDAPITRNRTIESIAISGTRSNVQIITEGQNEMSTLTMLDSFDSSAPTFTSTFTSPNSQLVPAITLPTGSQGTQFSLTESDGTVHMFGYITNGNYRYLDAGLTGVVRKGTAQEVTTATTTGTFTIADQGLAQSLTLAGDERGTFAAGDFISRSNLVAQAFRGMFIESVSFIGGNTLLVGTGGGGTTFDTTSTIYRAGPANEIQGTVAAFSYDPDTSDTVYSTAVTNQAFTTLGTGITENISEVANAITGLESSITWDGIITETGLPGVAIGTNPTRYEATISFGASWAVFSSADLADFVEFGVDDSVADFSNMFIGGNRFDATTSPGDFIRLTVGNSSAYFTVGAVTTVGTKDFTALGEAVGAVGTLGRTLIDGDNSAVLSVFSADPASSVTIDLGTENNIDSSFTITGGLNNMETVVNDDGILGNISPATTITIIDPEATEVASFTASVSNTTDNNVDVIASQIVDAVNNNTETPIDFTAVYDASSKIITLTAQLAGNTNFWSIVINNNGATAENAGNLATSSTQSGEIINQIDTMTVLNDLRVTKLEGIVDENLADNTQSFIRFERDGNQQLELGVGTNAIFMTTGGQFTGFGDTIMSSNVDVYGRFRLFRGAIDSFAFDYSFDDDVMDISATTINFNATTINGLPSGGAVTKAAVDTAIGVDTSTGLTTLFYNQRGGFTTPAGAGIGTVTEVTGATNQIVVANGTSTPFISLDSNITSTISNNTSNISINAGNIASNSTAITGILAKTDFITVTQAVDLDTIETATTTNATNIATNTTNIATNVTDIATNVTNIGTNATNIATNTTDIATNATNISTNFANINTNTNGISANATGILNNLNSLALKGDNISITDTTTLNLLRGTTVLGSVTLPSGGGTGASLSADNVFTGANTFNNAAGIVADRVVGIMDSDTYIDFSSANNIKLVSGGTEFLEGINFGTANAVVVNPNFADLNFIISKQTSGTAFRYDGGTDTLSTEAANVVGFGGGGGTSDYDDLTNAPITRIKEVDEFTLSGTRTNEVVLAANEMSTITMLDAFDSSTIAQTFTTTSLGGNTSITLGSGHGVVTGTLVELTEIDTTTHYGSVGSVGGSFVFVHGIDIGLTGELRTSRNAPNNIGDPVAQVAIASGASGTVSFAGDITSDVGVGDVISVLINTTSGGGCRVTDVTFNGTNTEITATNISQLNVTFFTTVNGVLVGRTPLDLLQIEAFFSYDPDFFNLVYTNQVTNEPFPNPGSDITTNLTHIGNTIAALDANITWDGTITSQRSTSTSITTTSTKFNTDNANRGVAGNWSFFGAGTVYYTPQDGDEWETLVDIGILESNQTTNSLFDNVQLGDLVTLAFGSGSASFLVGQKASLNNADFTGFTAVQNVNGTIGRTFVADEDFTLTVEIIEPDKSSITIDLGTQTNLNSNYSVAGGSNTFATLVNSDGQTAGDSTIASTITINDGDGNQVYSFTSSTENASGSNIDDVGNEIATLITESTESPVDYTATYNPNNKVVTIIPDIVGTYGAWSININHNSAPSSTIGDLAVSMANRVDDVVNQIDILSFTDGTYQTTAAEPTTKETVDTLIGVTPSSSGSLFYNKQGNFVTPLTVIGTAREIDISVSGATSTISIDATVTDEIARLSDIPTIPTADGEYKLVITSGVATWETI